MHCIFLEISGPRLVLKCKNEFVIVMSFAVCT